MQLLNFYPDTVLSVLKAVCHMRNCLGWEFSLDLWKRSLKILFKSLGGSVLKVREQGGRLRRKSDRLVTVMQKLFRGNASSGSGPCDISKLKNTEHLLCARYFKMGRHIHPLKIYVDKETEA